MKLIRLSIILLIACLFTSTLVTVEAQDSTLLTTAQSSDQVNSSSRVGHASPKLLRRRKPPRPVIPPATLLHNPEFLSGEASVSVAANSNPLIRIGIAQNG